MLEIKNVTKIYSTKGGTDTKALDDVSISFGETGLVFLLGKSGSGKSTLLNVCGGLDEPTSGEIIVKGKSSKSFSGSDFDSYRNTFVGFIFQEYNILDEFNVEDNIALALELQGKPKDAEKIRSLLRDVDLEEFAKRKPNTLSGGQKQRIAIARALVKDPQIIMADEPTGALDSATGKQVFDTLKKLSETRLVIVVSHDREFAEIYGDRIVELKDGKIIADVSKTFHAPRAVDENVSIIGGNTLSIRSGAKLTEENFKTIQNFISATDGDVIITNGEKQITSFKSANRISDDGATESFQDTQPESIVMKEYGAEDSKFIRSRLPATKAIKIGASGLKLKPVRLIFTILLSFIAFTMFGLLSTLMLYDGDKTARQSFMESSYDYLNLKKSYLTKIILPDYDYRNLTEIKFTDKDLENFQKDFGESTFGYYSTYNLSFSNVAVNKNKDKYYLNEIDKLACLPAEHKVLNNLRGTYPASVDEICISSYLVDVFKESAVREVKVNATEITTTENTLTINGPDDIIGEYLAVSVNNTAEAFKVTGVFESGAVDTKYDSLNSDSSDTNTGRLSYDFERYMQETMHCMALVSEDFYDKYVDSGIFVSNYDESNRNLYFNDYENEIAVKYTGAYFNDETNRFEDSEEYNQSVDRRFNVYDSESALPTHFIGTAAGKTSLSGDEIAVNLSVFVQLFEKELKQYFHDHATPEDAGDSYAAEHRYFNLDRTIGKYVYGYDYDGESETKLTKEERLAAFESVKDILKSVEPKQITMTIDNINNVTCTLVGFHEINLDLSRQDEYENSGVYASQEFIEANLKPLNNQPEGEKVTRYVREEGQRYNGLYVEYDKSEASIDKLLGMVGEDNRTDHDVVFELRVSLYDSITMANGYADMLSKIFLYVGIAFAVFSALLLFNFISVSISSKRKEIGILRAVGARGTDVFKIFFSEAGIIVGICTILSIIGAFGACLLINSILKSSLGFGVTLFVFGFASVGMMVGIALVIAFIATFLPVYLAARKKPVESIRAL